MKGAFILGLHAECAGQSVLPTAAAPQLPSAQNSPRAKAVSFAGHMLTFFLS